MNKTERKAELLDNYVATSSENTAKRDRRTLIKAYREIEPEDRSVMDPYIDEFMKGKPLKVIHQVAGRSPVKLSDCPTLSDIASSGWAFGVKSKEQYTLIMTQWGRTDKLI
jgi:hypothetical protein